MDEKTLTRFLSKVERQTTVTSPHVDTPCWLWVGAGNRRRGRLRVDSAIATAHRVAYEHWVGPLDGRLYCVRRCGNGTCVNPHHLDAKGRKRAPGAKLIGKRYTGRALTRAHVVAARELHRHGVSVREIASMMPVGAYRTLLAIRGATWSHVA
jgi:hypothetical protein